MAETQEIVTQENSAVLAELAKSFGETGGESISTSSLARLRIERENIADANGDIICPSGYFSVSTDDGKVFAKEVSFRYYEHRYRYKRYDAYAERTNKDGEKVQGAYIHSVLVKGPRDEAPSDDGDFQCGRPLEYIKDWKSLSKDRQEFLRSCRLMIIFYGEVTMKGVTQEGEKTEITIPVEIELSGKTSGKTLSKFFLDMVSKKRVLPNSRVVQMKSKKVSGGVTYYDIDVSVIDDTTYTMDDDTVALFSKFHDHIAQINKWIMEKHNSSNGSGEQDDDEDFIDINGSAA